MLLLFYIASLNARAYFNVRDNVKRDMQTVYENLYYELQLTRSAKRDAERTPHGYGDGFQLTRSAKRDCR